MTSFGPINSFGLSSSAFVPEFAVRWHDRVEGPNACFLPKTKDVAPGEAPLDQATEASMWMAPAGHRPTIFSLWAAKDDPEMIETIWLAATLTALLARRGSSFPEHWRGPEAHALVRNTLRQTGLVNTWHHAVTDTHPMSGHLSHRWLKPTCREDLVALALAEAAVTMTAMRCLIVGNRADRTMT